MKNIIYGLLDSKNDTIYYVGKSTVGNVRALSHLKQSHSDKVNNWVTEVTESGFHVNVIIIEELELLEHLNDREKHWVDSGSTCDRIRARHI